MPWHANFDADDETATFKCEDQVGWGTAPDEATCAFPEPSWGEDDVVFACSGVDEKELVPAAERTVLLALCFFKRTDARDATRRNKRSAKISSSSGLAAGHGRQGRRALRHDGLLVRRARHGRDARRADEGRVALRRLAGPARPPASTESSPSQPISPRRPEEGGRPPFPRRCVPRCMN